LQRRLVYLDYYLITITITIKQFKIIKINSNYRMHEEIIPEYFLEIFYNELLDKATLPLVGIYMIYKII
jgi:hypothetical protein